MVRFTHRLVAACGLAICCAGMLVAHARTSRRDTDLQDTVSDLEAKVGVYHVFGKLKLKDDQAAKLRACIETAQTAILASNEVFEDKLSDLKPYEKYYTEVIQNGWASEETVTAMRPFCKAYCKSTKPFADAIAPLGTQVEPILSKRQLAKLKELVKTDFVGMTRVLRGGWSVTEVSSKTALHNKWAIGHGAWTTTGRLLVAPYAKQALAATTKEKRASSHDAPVIAVVRDPSGGGGRFESMQNNHKKLNLAAGLQFSDDQLKKLLRLFDKNLAKTGCGRSELARNEIFEKLSFVNAGPHLVAKAQVSFGRDKLLRKIRANFLNTRMYQVLRDLQAARSK